jgi:alpha-amylase/alpha-mannosidase (GH57 family)
MNTSNKFVCIHGHFYQPPRENAWLEVIELQDSAAPFHDWNERINFECYAPNTAARILDEENFIRNIVNNYARISFNFGPTLLSWMETADPQTYRAILNADKISQAKFGGHGSAIAQVYSHLIMPLANRKDKETQVIWGMRDFESRFQRKPEGIWLAETAVDTETLEVLAENNIKYTILAPRQAKAVRKLKTDTWHGVNAENIDTRRPYLCRLPSGKSIVLFFYHGANSQGVAFDGFLNNGKYFGERITGIFDDNDHPQLAHIATDGESYGHHHRHGEMALAACLTHIEEHNLATITNYGAYLAQFPPDYEVEIHENSSWSCAHGVERWRSNCGCNTGGRPTWSQDWRKPLRETLNWLRDQLIPVYEKEAGKYLKDVWEARNDYIEVVLNRDPEAVDDFLKRHAKTSVSKEEKIRLNRLMEMQRQSMLMFTSCGWFFDEVTGIETLQILQYANRAIHYARQVAGAELHDKFLRRLDATPSNVYQHAGLGYRKEVLPAQVDLDRVGMHYAVSSLFEKYPEQLEFFNYTADSELFERVKAGGQMIAMGRTTVRSKITSSEKHFSFAALYLGQQNIIGNISIDMDLETYHEMKDSIVEAFHSTDLGKVIGLMQRYFGPEKYTIWHLFRDEKRKILKEVTDRNLESAEFSFRRIYKDNYQLMLGMQQSNIPIPTIFLDAIRFVWNKDLLEFFENGSIRDVRELERMMEERTRWELSFDTTFPLIASERIYQELKSMAQSSDLNYEQLINLIAILEILEEVKVEINFWKTQNVYFSMTKGYKNGEWVFVSNQWRDAFFRLGDLLRIRI